MEYIAKDYEENDFYIQDISNDKYDKQSNLPRDNNSYHNADNDNLNKSGLDNDKHSSLIKELEEKWDFIETNNNSSFKKRLLDIKNTSLYNTNNQQNKNNVFIEEWKEIFKASKQKYLTQKKNSANDNEEDFDLFVKRKIEHLRNHSKSIINKAVKSFLKNDEKVQNKEINHQHNPYTYYHSNHSFNPRQVHNDTKNSSFTQSVHSSSNINKEISKIYCKKKDSDYHPTKLHKWETVILNESTLSHNNYRIIRRSENIKKHQSIGKNKNDNMMNQYLSQKKTKKFPIKLINTTIGNKNLKKNRFNAQMKKGDQSIQILNRTKLLIDYLTLNKTHSNSSMRLSNYSKNSMNVSLTNEMRNAGYSTNVGNNQRRHYQRNYDIFIN